MPPKRKNKKRQKNSPRKSLSLSSYGAIGGFPQVKKARFRYADEVQLDCSASSFDSYIYRANGVSDPEHATGGHSPMGYGTYKSLYGQVVVDKCVMKVTYVGTGTTSNVIPSYFGIILSDTSGGTSGFTSVTDVFENKNVTNPRLCGLANRNESISVTKTYNARKYDHKGPWMGNDFGSSVSSTPEIDSFFTLYSASINASNGGAANFLVQLDYYCTFSGLKLGSQNA